MSVCVLLRKLLRGGWIHGVAKFLIAAECTFRRPQRRAHAYPSSNLRPFPPRCSLGGDQKRKIAACGGHSRDCCLGRRDVGLLGAGSKSRDFRRLELVDKEAAEIAQKNAAV